MDENEETESYSPTIKDLPADLRPRERLERVGEQALSTAELLAIILRTGVGGQNALSLATMLLSQFGGLAGLARASFAEIQDVKGMGFAKSAQVKAALELGRRMLLAAPEDRLAVRSPADLAQVLIAQMSHLDQEQLCTVFLDTRNRVLGSEMIYRGSLNASYIRIAEVFRAAVRRNCASIIVAHNHPSGDPSPSPEDVAVTRELVAAGRLLNVEVLDHLVVGQQRFVSLRERGLGFD
jgi:DNA repair protein RadC